MAEFENKIVDRRTVVRYLRKGIVDEKDFEKYLKALPDLADQAVPIEAAMEGEDDFEDDDDEE
jgi:nitrogen regulatory protein PII-like uncharacterized protein